MIPNVLVSRWAAKRDLKKVRIGLVIMSAFGIAPMIVRAFEFPALNVMWDRNAYGSVVWLLLGLLACLMFSRHGDTSRRFGDVEDNAMYWNFVVVTWLPIYLCLYWVPRL